MGLGDESMSWALEEALPAKLFLQEGPVLVKPPFNPSDTASFAHPQFSAHQPYEAFVVGHQNHATLKDRGVGRIRVHRGAPRPVSGLTPRHTHPEVVECAAQSLNRLHVQMVGGFVQNVEVGAEG